MTHRTQIVELDVSDLIPAEWNYKTAGTEEEIAKLANSIGLDKSAGVPAVREVGERFEVIDGNHRLAAIKVLGWERVPCENFGDITKAMAIIIARRRNHKWFEDDVLQYAELFTDDVLKEFSLDDLEPIMPDRREEMEALTKLLDFDWSQYDTATTHDNGDEKIVLKLELNTETYTMWKQWKEQCAELLGYDNDGRCMELALVEALNVPVTSST